MYEISLAVARMVLGQKIQRQREELEEAARQDAEWQEEWAAIKARRAEKKAREAEEDEG
jgi:sec-independent protein translocase protein TatC